MPSTSISTLAPAARKALAKQVLADRKAGLAWDGPKGICVKRNLSGAPVGRKLLREAGHGDQIARTYDHQAAADARKAAKVEPKPKRQPKAPKIKVAAKVAK